VPEERSARDSGALHILGGGRVTKKKTFYASEPNSEAVFPGGIHVYEKTCRLGGKGASGRSSTAAIEHRIEEHGLHVWFGFYDNAFALLSKCHDYLERNPNEQRRASGLRSVAAGFRAASRLAIMDHDGSS